jgi:hypothetical protein
MMTMTTTAVTTAVTTTARETLSLMAECNPPYKINNNSNYKKKYGA